MRYIAIVIFGEYDCHDALVRHEKESHKSKDWKDIHDKENCFVEIHRFDTKEERRAFACGIERADNYFSSDYYTVICQTDRIEDSL